MGRNDNGLSSIERPRSSSVGRNYRTRDLPIPRGEAGVVVGVRVAGVLVIPSSLYCTSTLPGTGGVVNQPFVHQKRRSRRTACARRLRLLDRNGSISTSRPF